MIPRKLLVDVAVVVDEEDGKLLAAGEQWAAVGHAVGDDDTGEVGNAVGGKKVPEFAGEGYL